MTMQSYPYNNTIRSTALSALLAGLTACSASAFAQDVGGTPQQPATGGTVGLAVLSMPAYQGADHRRVIGTPMGEYRWANGVFIGRDGVIGYELAARPDLQVGVQLGVDRGRKEGDSRYLNGMGDIDAKLTYGGYVKATLGGSLELSSAVQVGSGNDNAGALLTLGAAYALPIPGAVQVRVVVGTTWANAAYMASNFGINVQQSRASGYKTYDPASGVRDTSFGVELAYPVSRQWIMIGSVKSTTLEGSAKDSPLVRQATDTLVFAGCLYAF